MYYTVWHCVDPIKHCYITKWYCGITIESDNDTLGHRNVITEKIYFTIDLCGVTKWLHGDPIRHCVDSLWHCVDRIGHCSVTIWYFDITIVYCDFIIGNDLKTSGF